MHKLLFGQTERITKYMCQMRLLRVFATTHKTMMLSITTNGTQKSSSHQRRSFRSSGRNYKDERQYMFFFLLLVGVGFDCWCCCQFPSSPSPLLCLCKRTTFDPLSLHPARSTSLCCTESCHHCMRQSKSRRIVALLLHQATF